MSSLHPGLFVAEGTSDAPLADLVEVLFLRCGVQVKLSRPDFALLKVAKDVASRVEAGLALVAADVDVIVVHRDADNAGSAARIAEIEAAVRQVGSRASVVPVVPCRMTEAWLLLDERAIRHVAGNPNGRASLPGRVAGGPTGSYRRRMRVDDGRPSAVARFPLGRAVADMYADLRVSPLLRRLLTHSRELLGTVAGSISLVDTANGRYDKVAENGIACRLGHSFPLDEGATGAAVARRMPVVIDDYRDVRGCHLPPGHPASRGAAAAVPLWWRGEVIGVNVAFAGHRRRFTTAEVDALELLTQSVAPAAVRAGLAVPSPAGLPRGYGRVAAGGSGAQAVVQPAVQPVGTEGGPVPRAGFPHTPERAPAVGPLTPRETDVLRLLAGGLSDREIATRLGISPKTVEKHVGAVLRKTGTAGRTAAVMRALDRGWLAVPTGETSSAHR